MEIIRELKRRLRAHAPTDLGEVARLALLELAQMHLAHVGEESTVLDALIFIQRAAGEAVQSLQALGLPEPTDAAATARRLAELGDVLAARFEPPAWLLEALDAGPPPPTRETEAIAEGFLEQLRARSHEIERGCEDDEPGRLPDDGRNHLVPEARDDGPVVPVPAKRKARKTPAPPRVPEPTPEPMEGEDF